MVDTFHTYPLDDLTMETSIRGEECCQTVGEKSDDDAED